MAALAAIRCLAVINGGYWQPIDTGMASITNICRHRVAGGFERRAAGAIVAAGLGARLAGDCAVIKSRTQPGGGGVTAVTRLSSHDVPRPLAGGHRAIVAVLAGICGLIVRKR